MFGSIFFICVLEVSIPKNRLMEILIELHPVLGKIKYQDLYNNFVEILDSIAAEDECWEYQYWRGDI
jgi:hypothetical protein